MAKRGRPRQFRNGAERQKAYRLRKKWERERDIRFEALRKYPMGRNFDNVYPGDCCVLCGLTVFWKSKDDRDWSLKYTKYRHIPIVHWEGWKLTPDDWLLCPDCASGKCDCPIQVDPVKKIEWGDFDEYVKRTTV